MGTAARSTSRGEKSRAISRRAWTSCRQESTSRAHSRRSPCWTRAARRSQAAPSARAVTVTTWYEGPVPWAWCRNQSSLASPSPARISIHPARKAASNSLSLAPPTGCPSWRNSIRAVSFPGPEGARVANSQKIHQIERLNPKWRGGQIVYPRVHAATSPDKAALIMATSGEVVTYRELDDRSCRLARLFWGAGLRAGDHVAIFMENHPRYFEVAWAALRSGLYLTPVSSYLTAAEAADVVNDCQARVLVTSAAHREVAERIVPDTPGVEVRLMVDTTSGAPVGHEPYDDGIARYPAAPLDDEPLGDLMFYSSGTTGRPKGIKRPLTGRNAREGNVLLVPLLQSLYGVGEDTVYLSPAPLYQ